MLPDAGLQHRRQATKDAAVANAARLVATGGHKPGNAGDGEGKPPSVAPGGLTELREHPVHEVGMHGGPSVSKRSRCPLEQPLAERSPERPPGRGVITDAKCDNPAAGPAKGREHSSYERWVRACPAAIVSTRTKPVKGVALAVWNRATGGSLHCLRIEQRDEEEEAEGTPRARRRRPVLRGTHIRGTGSLRIYAWNFKQGDQTALQRRTSNSTSRPLFGFACERSPMLASNLAWLSVFAEPIILNQNDNGKDPGLRTESLAVKGGKPARVKPGFTVVQNKPS